LLSVATSESIKKKKEKICWVCVACLAFRLFSCATPASVATIQSKNKNKNKIKYKKVLDVWCLPDSVVQQLCITSFWVQACQA
jgi:hypothetical protein